MNIVVEEQLGCLELLTFQGAGMSSEKIMKWACSPLQSKTAILYSESIDKLKAVLSAMHNMSQKREKLEKKLRFQLESEICQLKGKDGEGKEKEDIADGLAEMKLQNATLESDVVKVSSYTLLKQSKCW